MLYKYIKSKPGRVARVFGAPKAAKARVPRKLSAFLALSFFLCGLFLVGQVAYPIVGWYLYVLPAYSGGIVSPLATSYRPEDSPLFPVVVRASEIASSTSSDSSYDLGNWFSGGPKKPASGEDAKLKTYTISIPKLSIDSATVEIGGDDLKKSLVAWPTSAVPGTYGTNIMFGHSELPQFARPNDYSGIFTHIMELEKGDEIFVDYDGVRYRYEMVDKKIVSPTDYSILEQRFDSSYITLITCEPAGTTWMRGVVRARLTQI